MIATIASREDDVKMIADAMAKYTGEVVHVEGFVSKPPPPRREWVDPRTKLTRKAPTPPKMLLSERKQAALERLHYINSLPREQRPPTLYELARIHGISRSTIQRRLSMGMTIEQALASTDVKLDGRTREAKVKNEQSGA